MNKLAALLLATALISPAFAQQKTEEAKPMAKKCACKAECKCAQGECPCKPDACKCKGCKNTKKHVHGTDCKH